MQVRCYNGQDQFQFRCCQMYSGGPTFVLDTVLLGRIAVHKTRPTVTHVAWSVSVCPTVYHERQPSPSKRRSTFWLWGYTLGHIGADSTGATGNFAPVLTQEPGQTLRFAPVSFMAVL